MHMADRSQYAPRPMVVFATDILVRSTVNEGLERGGGYSWSCLCTAAGSAALLQSLGAVRRVFAYELRTIHIMREAPPETLCDSREEASCTLKTASKDRFRQPLSNLCLIGVRKSHAVPIALKLSLCAGLGGGGNGWRGFFAPRRWCARLF